MSVVGEKKLNSVSGTPIAHISIAMRTEGVPCAPGGLEFFAGSAEGNAGGPQQSLRIVCHPTQLYQRCGGAVQSFHNIASCGVRPCCGL